MHSSFSDRWAERTRSANTCKSFGNGSSPSLPPICPKQMAAFGKAVFLVPSTKNIHDQTCPCRMGHMRAYRHAMPWAACMMLHIWIISLPHGHHGTRPCSTDHGDAAGPVGPAVDSVLPFVITERSPFPLLAAWLAASLVGHPVPRGRWNI